jgi:hypothetical protein
MFRHSVASSSGAQEVADMPTLGVLAALQPASRMGVMATAAVRAKRIVRTPKCVHKLTADAADRMFVTRRTGANVPNDRLAPTRSPTVGGRFLPDPATSGRFVTIRGRRSGRVESTDDATVAVRQHPGSARGGPGWHLVTATQSDGGGATHGT